MIFKNQHDFNFYNIQEVEKVEKVQPAIPKRPERYTYHEKVAQILSLACIRFNFQKNAFFKSWSCASFTFWQKLDISFDKLTNCTFKDKQPLLIELGILRLVLFLLCLHFYHFRLVLRIPSISESRYTFCT